VTYLAVDAAIAKSTALTRSRLRNAANLTREKRQDREIPLLSLSVRHGLRYRGEGGLGRQAPSADSLANYWVVQPGDVIVNPMWLLEGSVGVSALWGAVSPAYRVYRPCSGTDGRFLAYLLGSSPYIQQYQLLIRGLTTFDRAIGREDLDDIPVALPELEEQRGVADFLDRQTTRIDHLMELRGHQVEQAKLARSAAMIETFFGSDHQQVRLSAVAAVSHGRQRSPEHESGPFMTPYIRSANVKDGLITTDDVKEMNFNPAERAQYGLRVGDVLVTEAAGSAEAIGASAIWRGEIDGPVCFQNHVLRLRPSTPLWANEYLYWWARASYAAGAMRVYATGANILNLGSESIKAMMVPARSPDEQSDCVQLCEARVGHLDDVATATAGHRQLLAERRAALITAAVTGQFDPTTSRGVA